MRFAWRGAVAIALVAILVRVAVRWAGSAHDLQTWEYDEIARNVLSGRGYGMEYRGAWYRTIGSAPYTYLTIALYSVFGLRPGPLELVQWFVSGAGVLGAWIVASRLFSPRVGLLAAALVSLHPGLVFYDTHNLHPLGFDAALVMWSVVMLVFVVVGAPPAAIVAAGVIHGLAVFERTTWAALPLLSLGWLGWKARYRLTIVYLVMFIVILLPWMVRSLRIYGDLTLNAASAELLWRGNNAVGDGGSFARGSRDVPVFTAANAEFRARVLAADEIEQRKLFTAATIDFVSRHPTETLRLFSRKFLGFWWFMPQSGLLYPAAYRAIYTAYYGAVVAFAVLGTWFGMRAGGVRRRLTVTVLGFLLLVSVAQAIFYVEIRHRWSIEPIILVFCAAGVMALVDRVRQAHEAPLASGTEHRTVAVPNAPSSPHASH